MKQLIDIGLCPAPGLVGKVMCRCLPPLLVFLLLGPIVVGADAWPLFRGNALQTGVAACTLPEQLAVRWTFEAKDSIEATAAIVGNTVYVGAMDEHLYALDLATGKPRWAYKAGPFKAPVSVWKGAVYAGDLDGFFHCIDSVTGQKRWSYETGAEISSGANFAGDTILFGSGDEVLYCLTSDGKVSWKFKVPGGPVLGSPVIAGDRTFAAGCDSILHVIDVAKGTELASLTLGGQVGATAAVDGDHLYVGTMTNQFLALDWKKPAIEWTFEAERRPQPFYASAALTDKLVLVGSRDKHVYAFDRQTGKPVWSFATRDKVDSSPVVVGQRVYVGSSDGHLYVLDLAMGTEVQKLNLGSAVLASPAVANNCLVIGTRKGTFYCLGAKN
jgi:outer membrane protein assembly factor BamB